MFNNTLHFTALPKPAEWVIDAYQPLHSIACSESPTKNERKSYLVWLVWQILRIKYSSRVNSK